MKSQSSWVTVDRERAGRVPDRGSPTVRGRRLAAELRRLRERTGLNGEEVAERLGWSGSKVSRIELGRTGVKQADLRQLLDLYGVEEPYRQDLIALARESAKRGPLRQITSAFPPESEYAAYLSAEAEAESVWNWEPQVVPGLLQTYDYARAAMEAWQIMFPGPPREIERRVEAKLLRQQVLTRDPPLDLSVVIDESVLHRRFGSRQVMRQQLKRLLEASELPNVQVRIYRLDADDAPLTAGAFSYMQFPYVHDVPFHDIVSVEHLQGTYTLEDEDQTYKYRVAFEYLVSRALTPEESRSLISARSEAWS
jgi:transcriptional regulator with XRE-family HTH domain